MASALDVARQLVFLAAAETEPDFLTPLRLQKLLYYCQGWHLAETGRPLFPERIEAWATGPVVPDVFAAFEPWGCRAIEFQEVEAPENLTDDEVEFICRIWEGYKEFSSTGLRAMTNDEAPWRTARKGCGAISTCSVEIAHAALADFFAPLLAAQP